MPRENHNGARRSARNARFCGKGAAGAGGPPAEPGDDVTPIGGIYLSLVSTDPGLPSVSGGLGYGTWARIGQGRVLVGVNEADPDFEDPELELGSQTITPAGSVQQATFTGSALGTHSHTAGTLAPSPHSGTAVAAHASHTHGAGTLDNAAASAGTPAGTNSAPTFTGAALGTHAHELPFQLSSTTATRQIAAATFGGGTSRASTGTSAAGSANTTSAAVALSQAVSAGTPSGTVSAPVFTGAALATHDHAISGSTGNESASLTHGVTQPSDHTMSGTSQAVSAGSPSGTINAQSFTGQAHSNLQPSLTVFMWSRTA